MSDSHEIFNDQRLHQRVNTLDLIVRDTHVVYTDGDHGTTYINKRKLLVNPWAVADFAGCLAARFRGMRIDTVIGPGVMGAVLSTWVAHHLSFETTALVAGICAEKENGKLIIKPEFRAQITGRNVLLVDDVVHKGRTQRQMHALVSAWEGNVVAAGALFDRGHETAATLGVPRLECLLHYDLESHKAGACPQCAAGIPVNTNLGHGAEFLATQTT